MKTAPAVTTVALALVLVTGCSPDTPAADPTALPSATSTPAPSIVGDFDVGDGKMLHLECRGTGEPTIVLDVGNDDTVSGSWGAVYEPLQSVGRVCAYDRANLGSSDPDLGPRTVEDVSEDLVTLLHVANVPKPYVLVGGSFGGNIVGLVAANHPDEVAGIVFADSDPANDDPELDPFLQNLPKKEYDQCCAPGLYEPPYDAEENVEHIDWKGGSAAELDSVHRLPKVPIIVLTAALPDCEPSWPCEEIAEDIARLQAEWIKGNPRGSQMVVDSGHVMQREAPQAIIDATKAVIVAASAT